jgi:hypothetical protein
LWVLTSFLKGVANIAGLNKNAKQGKKIFGFGSQNIDN